VPIKVTCYLLIFYVLALILTDIQVHKLVKNKVNIILYINYKNVVINNNLWKAPRPYFALQNSHRHGEVFLWKSIDNLDTRRFANPVLSVRLALH